MNAPVTAYIPSRNRYFTTLPSAVLSIIQQTVKPERFILFLDGDHIDLRENELYAGLFRMLELNHIAWEVVLSPRRGLVANHQHAIELARSEWIWRCDDDTFPEPTVLERLLSCDSPEVGAVAGLVIDPRMGERLPPDVHPTLKYLGRNVQWYLNDSKEIIEAEHLYSTFIFRREAGQGCCCLDLGPVSHREDTMFSHGIYRKGYKLLINPNAITWHVRQGKDGIRTFQEHPEYWDFDERVFRFNLKQWGYKPDKLVVLDNGKGDHIMFKMILPEIRKKLNGQKLVLAVCYPELFVEEPDIELISIAEAKDMCNFLGKQIDDFNIYKFCIDKKWKSSLTEAYLELYS